MITRTQKIFKQENTFKEEKYTQERTQTLKGKYALK